VDRKRETVLKIRRKNDPPAVLMNRHDFIGGKNEGLFIKKQTLPLELAVVGGVECGAPPEHFFHSALRFLLGG
jgi:hypothetical protein